MNTPANLYYLFLDGKPIDKGTEDKDKAIQQCEDLRTKTGKDYTVIRGNIFGTGIKVYPKGVA